MMKKVTFLSFMATTCLFACIVSGALAQTVKKVSLYTATNDAFALEVVDGKTYTFSTTPLPSFAIVVDLGFDTRKKIAKRIASVDAILDTTIYGPAFKGGKLHPPRQRSAPYSIFGSNKLDLLGKVLVPGKYTLYMSVINKRNLKVAASKSRITFTIAQKKDTTLPGVQCIPPPCDNGALKCLNGDCESGCGMVCVKLPQILITPQPVCTPVACSNGQLQCLSGLCPGGCGRVCVRNVELPGVIM